MHYRYLQVALTGLLLCSSLLLSNRIDRGLIAVPPVAGPYSVLTDPALQIELSRNRLAVIGTTQSVAHDTALHEFIHKHFATIEIQTTLSPGLNVPEDWEVLSLRLLDTFTILQSATALMRKDSIDIRGVAYDQDNLAASMERLRQIMPADATLQANVKFVDATTSLAKLCRRTFKNIVSEPVDFRGSSAAIRGSSYPVLDEVINLLYDCSDESITITGHTDSSGPEAWNRQLSLLRAQAVADYLILGGISRQRITTMGQGSSVPIADNSTANGRRRNRRIELELR